MDLMKGNNHIGLNCIIVYVSVTVEGFNLKVFNTEETFN